MNVRKVQYALLAAIAATLVACDNQNADDRIVGQLESDRIEITAEVSEPIVERAIVEGEPVASGQLLIRQDTTRIEVRIAEAEAILLQTRARLDELIRGPRREQILAARANVEGAKKELAFRETDLERAIQVFERELASPEVRDRAQVARDTARASLDNLEARLEELLTGTTPEELRQAEGAVKQSEARLESLKVDLERHTAFAPSDGVIDSLLFEPGERPAAGQPMAILLSGAQVHARVFVPVAIRAQVTPGTGASVYVDGRDTPFQGRVRWVSSESAFTPYFALTERDRGRLTFAAKVDILDAGERLPDGVPVEVRLELDQLRD